MTGLSYQILHSESREFVLALVFVRVHEVRLASQDCWRIRQSINLERTVMPERKVFP
jgi:hypothetical protein